MSEPICPKGKKIADAGHIKAVLVVGAERPGKIRSCRKTVKYMSEKKKSKAFSCLSSQCCSQDVVLERPAQGGYSTRFCWTRSCPVYLLQKTNAKKRQEGEKKIVRGGPYRACGPSRKFLPANSFYFRVPKLGRILGTAHVWEASGLMPPLPQRKNKH